MIISCPSCSARYQLADSKIKTSGTRVRCPRCSHTFTVHPRREEDEISERTELFARRDDFLSKPKEQKETEKKPSALFDESESTKAPKPEAPKRVESPPKQAQEKQPEKEVKTKQEPEAEAEAEDVFDQKTMVSNEAPKDILSKVKKSRKPKDDPARVVSPKEIDEESEETWGEVGQVQEGDSTEGLELELSQDSSKPEGRPFGEATMLELRKVGQKSLKLKKYIKPVAAGLVIVGALYGVYFLIQQIDFSEVGSSESQQASAVVRPEAWYADLPGVYQDQLARIAALPEEDQESVENRALLAEALILNGLLSGAKDQVLSGLGIASGISLTQPNLAHGFYGLSAYAIGNNDEKMMLDLLSRWPEASQSGPEYRLLELLSLASQRKAEEALVAAQNLLKDFPEFQRGTDYSLLVALRNPAATQKVLNEGFLESLVADYQQHRETLNASLSELPKLYQSIDRRLKRSSLLPEASAPKEQREPQPEETPEPAPQPAEAESPDLAKPLPPNPMERKSTASRSRPTSLPKEDRQLVARNRASQNDRAAAEKLYEQGNEVYKSGSQDKALELYREALRKDPEFAEAYRQIGTIYMARKQPERALKSFKIYLTLRPQSSDKQMVESWINSLE